MVKVSVIIPAYNAMKYLPETVDSVLFQTFQDFEVLIIDDGSSDNIREWALNLTDERAKLISQKNQGLPGARNTGINHAQGDYIAFVDADDLWEPTKLAKQVKCLDENPTVGLVHTWMLLIDEYGKSTGRVMKSFADGNVWQQLLERNFIACPSVMVRRCCFANAGLFDQDLRSIEDWDMWIRIAALYSFAVIKEPLAYYRQLPNSMSKNCQVMNEAFITVIEKAFKSVPQELLYLKNRSYSNANLCLAWKALQSKNRDYKLALHYRAKAIEYNQNLRFSQEYILLSLAIAALQLFGVHSYTQVLKLLYKFRRQLLSLG
ncbi:MAG: glycosyltransferase [Goleter apudmare HA4340-LM2]|jgi:glycosyltransferase involved in cell wall biosynthesis|nr:glycosyltransferase [Goleter apudmare HA4340-LM2]